MNLRLADKAEAPAWRPGVSRATFQFLIPRLTLGHPGGVVEKVNDAGRQGRRRRIFSGWSRNGLRIKGITRPEGQVAVHLYFT
jgi:hypothetical protein